MVDVKKIQFLALHLGYGGAEKAIIAEANMLAEKYEVEIVCAYKLYAEPAFWLDERVKITYLSENIKPNKKELQEALKSKNPIKIAKEGIKSLYILFYRKTAIKKYILRTKADIIISTRYIYNDLLGKTRKQGVITIAQEHNHHRGNARYIKKMVRSVRQLDYFMPVSKELTEFYAKRIKKAKCVYIPHSLDEIPTQTSMLQEPMIISVGRLSEEKGFVDLVGIYAEVEKEFPEWKLHIVGDGDTRKEIENRIEMHKLQGKVILHGFRDKSYINSLLEKASIYVMTSHTEAFGIVLIEAQSYGIPCLAFDSAKGAMEIIKHGENGYLVSDRDVKKMTVCIKKLIMDYQLRKYMGMMARENSLHYSQERVKELWFNFIENM